MDRSPNYSQQQNEGQQYQKAKDAIQTVSQLSKKLFKQNLFDQKAPQTIEQYKQIPEISEIISFVQSLNPHLSSISKDIVDEFINFQILKESLMPLSSEKQKENDRDTSEFIRVLKQKLPNVQQVQTLSKQQQTDLAMGILYTKLTESGHKIFISPNLKDVDQCAHTYKKHIVTINEQDSSTYLMTKFDNIDFQDFLFSKGKRDHLISTLIKLSCQNYELTPEEVQVVGIHQGSAEITFKIPISIAEAKSKLITPDQIVGILKLDKVEYAPTSANQVTVTTSSSLTNFTVQPDFFSPQYNFYWDESHTNMVDYRGSIQYKDKGLVKQRYYFPVGYTGIAINVKEYNDNDNSGWFGNTADKNTWIVLFHGTKNGQQKGGNWQVGGMSGILKSKQINKISLDAYSGSPCLIKGGKIPDGNVYLAEKIDVTNSYNKIQFNGVSYNFVYQCRVDPTKIRCAQAGEHLYYLMNKADFNAIRPYRFLIKSNQ